MGESGYTENDIIVPVWGGESDDNNDDCEGDAADETDLLDVDIQPGFSDEQEIIERLGETEEVNFYDEECEDYDQGNDDGGDRKDGDDEPVVEEPVTEAPENEDNSDCYSDDTFDNAGDDLGLVDYRNLNDDDNNSFEDI